MTQEKLQEASMLSDLIEEYVGNLKQWEQADSVDSVTLKTGYYKCSIPLIVDFESLRGQVIAKIQDRLRDLRYQFESL